MTPDEKLTTLLVKLNRLTSLEKIKWDVIDAPKAITRGTDDHIPLLLTTTYKGQKFALYQQRYQSFDGEHERFYWNQRLVLAILDEMDRAIWEASNQQSALYDLFETARNKVANIDEVIDELLDNDD